MANDNTFMLPISSFKYSGWANKKLDGALVAKTVCEMIKGDFNKPVIIAQDGSVKSGHEYIQAALIRKREEVLCGLEGEYEEDGNH